MRSLFFEGFFNIDILLSCLVDKIEYFWYIQGIVYCFGELKVYLLKLFIWCNLNMYKLILMIFFLFFLKGCLFLLYYRLSFKLFQIGYFNNQEVYSMN